MSIEITTTAEIRAALDLGGPLIQTTTVRGGRRYLLSHLEDTPAVPSVTSIVDGIMRNYGLERWRQQWIERGLEARLGQQLTAEAVEEVLGAASTEASASAELGSEVHTIIDALLRGEEIDYRPALEPAVQAWLRWRRAHMDWSYLGSEVGVWTLDYAGTVDALFGSADGSEMYIVDWKTSSGIYDSACLQLAAYAHALETMMAADSPYYLGVRVRGQVVRICAEYPRINGERDRTQAKQFDGRVEYAWVAPEQWYPVFKSALDLSVGKRQRIKKEMLK